MRKPLIVITTILLAGSLAFVVLLLVSGDSAAAARANARSRQEIETAVPENDPFTATLSISPGSPLVSIGDELSITLDLNVAEGCRYPILELILYQQGDDAPLFEHIDPPDPKVTPPVQFPLIYKLRAAAPGAITFRARTFGERYCDDYWNWYYLGAETGLVTVSPAPTSDLYLPYVSR